MASNRKLGIALSGGGFRAALFHVGVLAWLAEEGRLGQVEVISTVSGGSIIGALYYLHVKKLLESKRDDGKRRVHKDEDEQLLSDADFVDLVKKIEESLLSVVRTNLRMRTFAHPGKVIRMAVSGYNRTDRFGELLDVALYQPVFEGTTKAIDLSDLRIKLPQGGPGQRCYRVPELLINTTCLNTGRNWRFSADKMGEPKLAGLQEDIDTRARLESPPSYDGVAGISVGKAVAASAAVPGLFPPVSISGLYGDWDSLQLVDGGVHDNQGIQGLRDRGCTDYLISDASSQMEDVRDPSREALDVIVRMNSVLMEGLRDEQLARTFEEQEHDRHTALLHLRRGIAPVEWRLRTQGMDGSRN